MSAKAAALVSIFLAGALAAAPASADDYNLLDFPLTFSGGATAATASLTTDFKGSLTDPSAILALLNSSSYSATMYGSGGVLSQLDNSNSFWEFVVFGDSPSAELVVDGAGMHLSFSTAAEGAGDILTLRSLDHLTILEYYQLNNVSDTNYVIFAFNAVHSATDPLPYGSTFLFPTAAIPEPEILSSLALGLLLLPWAARKRRRGR